MLGDNYLKNGKGWACFDADLICENCGWGPIDHGFDAYHGEHYCVFDRNEERKVADDG